MSRPLSVLVVSRVASVWGAQRRLLDLAPRLRDDGVSLTLACPEGELAERWRDLGHRHVELRLPTHRGVRRPDDRRRPGPVALARELGVVAASTIAVARVARRHDLVHSHSLYAHLEVAAAGMVVRTPSVLDLHDIVEDGLGRRLLGIASRLASLTIANSEATAATIAGGGAHVVVHPGVDLERFRPGPADPVVRASLSADPASPLVGIIGRIDPNKCVDVVVEAVGAIPGARLVVVGRAHIGAPEHAAAVRERASQLLGDRARFVEPREDMPDVLRAVDVLVNASVHEPFGRTVLEAQACGIPVIGTSAGGIPEFVEHGVTGLLVPPRDIEALRSAIAQLLDDGHLARRLADGALAQAEGRFGLAAQARSMAAAYRRAAA